MKHVLPLLLALLLLQGCIPGRIAPTISDYKITKGKRFKRGLPKKTVFVFEDPKPAGHFYDYINTKFQLDDYYVDVQVPFSVANNNYFFSFYEVEIKDKSLNLFPALFNAVMNEALGSEEEEYISGRDVLENENRYIAIEVFSSLEKDCLHEDYPSRKEVLVYLRDLKKEYLTTHNYNEVLFKD
ncbi:MAG: hypothetical protein CMH48_05585 [Muricauda sp.]|nr:hypothetical protein [Allomuricauda sp.]MAU26271.1 hypothetical protein [Allomuricauda sp.]MBC30297.1 hypothetical protein [Allomuricauda sp.]